MKNIKWLKIRRKIKQKKGEERRENKRNNTYLAVHQEGQKYRNKGELFEKIKNLNFHQNLKK